MVSLRKAKKLFKAAPAVPPVKNLGGRPEKVIDWDEVGRLAQLQCTAEEIAFAVKVTRQTLSTRSQKDNGVMLEDFIADHSGRGRVSLRRLIHKVCEGDYLVKRITRTKRNGDSEVEETFATPNPTMLIFTAKNELGWVDAMKSDVSLKGDVNVHRDASEFTDAELTLIATGGRTGTVKAPVGPVSPN